VKEISPNKISKHHKMLVSVGLPDISLIPPAAVLSRSPPHGVPMELVPPSEGRVLSLYSSIDELSVVRDLDMCPWPTASSDFLETMMALYVNGVVNMALIYFLVFFTGMYVLRDKK